MILHPIPHGYADTTEHPAGRPAGDVNLGLLPPFLRALLLLEPCGDEIVVLLVQRTRDRVRLAEGLGKRLEILVAEDSTAPLRSFGTFTVHQVCALALWSRLALRVVDPLQALDLAAGLLALALVVVCAEKLLREIALHGLRIEVDVVLVIRVRLIPRLDLLVGFEECFFGLERGWPVSCLRNALKLRGGLRYATVEVCPLFVHRAHCDLLGTLRFSDVGNGAGGKSDGLCNPHAHRHLLGRDQWLIG